MNQYAHTQPGRLLGIILIVITLFVLAISIPALLKSDFEEWPGIAIPAIVFPAIYALFHSLTVSVTPTEICIVFGVGLIQKTILLEDIEEARTGQSRWYHGWGIRKVSRGWLYNIAGYDIVHLEMKNGRVVQIGTDDQEALLKAIEAGLQKSA